MLARFTKYTLGEPQAFDLDDEGNLVPHDPEKPSDVTPGCYTVKDVFSGTQIVLSTEPPAGTI